MNKLKIEYVNIAELKPYENNPRDNSKAIEQVAKSIKEFGFKVPIVIDENNVIVTGHTRYEACKKLGIKEVPCIIANDLTKKQIKAFRLADNKVSDYSIWDNKKLLEELDDIGFDIFTGFIESDIFGEQLDEKDNEFLNEIVEDIGKSNLLIKYQCKTLEQFNEIMGFIESIKGDYE